MNKIISFSIFYFLFSCSVDSKKDKLNEVKEPAPLVIGLKSFEMEPGFFEKTTFLNGEPLNQAQSSTEWTKACENHEPVWCYVDAKNKEGILYNYYAFSDKRGLVSKEKILYFSDIELFQNELISNSKSIQFNWLKGSSVERSFNGQNYDLKFVNIWIKNDSDSLGTVNVAIIDQKTNKLKIESVSPNNGYRIWLKK